MIIIIDYGMGNLRSIRKALDRLEIASRISSDAGDIATAERLILPGVGHFSRGMKNLREMGLLTALNRAVLERHVPILGICLGMQLFCRRSEEGDAEGMGWLDAETVRFAVQDPIQYKVPHIGWNSIRKKKGHPLLSQLREDQLFYFVHSYHVRCNQSQDILGLTRYDYEFVSAVHKGNIFGTQFHPEKSRSIGLQLLKNFAECI